MNKLIRLYNQNRHLFWIIILTIIAIIAIVQILNNFVVQKKDEETMENEQNIVSTNTTNKINSNYAVVNGKEVKTNKTKIIDKFLDYCNNQEIEEAYELLSKECKQILYPTLNDFKEKYYNRIFSSKKTYLCQAWIVDDSLYTYKIDFTEDMLSTGNVPKSSIIDYYTVVDEDGASKLNINKFIGIKPINVTKTNDNITVNIIRKIIYMDYEIYDIKVTNKTKSTIMLDDLQSPKNIYIEDKNEQKYLWYIHEILEDEITIKNGFTEDIKLKFNKSYNPNNEAVKMIFSKVVLDSNTNIELIVDFN